MTSQAQSTLRQSRVRHGVRDGAMVMLFSAASSVGFAFLLTTLARVAGS